MTARLVTIPISHYCEKARWALDRAGIPYVEERHVQAIHIWHARRAGGGRTVPVLVSAAGEVVPESSAILRWTDAQRAGGQELYPQGEVGAAAAAIEARLDAGLGPDGRLWMYQQTLPVIKQMGTWALAGTPRWERRAFAVGGRALDPIIRRYLGVDAPAAATALTRVHAVFDEIATLLSDGRPFLTGDRFTAADVTFAALAAPMTLPSAYGSPLPPPEDMPAGMAEEVVRLREHPAGRFALRMYDEHRCLSAACR